MIISTHFVFAAGAEATAEAAAGAAADAEGAAWAEAPAADLAGTDGISAWKSDRDAASCQSKQSPAETHRLKAKKVGVIQRCQEGDLKGAHSSETSGECTHLVLHHIAHVLHMCCALKPRLPGLQI